MNIARSMAYNVIREEGRLGLNEASSRVNNRLIFNRHIFLAFLQCYCGVKLNLINIESK